jgi:hypothetical protein
MLLLVLLLRMVHAAQLDNLLAAILFLFLANISGTSYIKNS